MIKGLIFDLDGVITETDMLHYNAWKNEVAKHGVEFTIEQNNKLKGIPRMETLLGILKLNNLEGKFDQKQLEEMCENKNNAYKEKLKTDIDHNDILPGVEQLLKDAKELGLKMAICSSSRNAPVILEKIGLKDYFEFIVDPASVKDGKPAPDIYLAACEGINLKPNEVIGFEDAMPGVVGLVAAKVPTVAITHNQPGEWDKADIVFNKTDEMNLKDILEKINA